ncbi:hypothetical protein LSH36_503g04025, partial [Paralvinella palmiformis]
FFLLGFKKCGTTDIFTALSKIPDFTTPLAKEPAFWDMYRLPYKIQKGRLPKGILSTNSYIHIYDASAEQIRQHTIIIEDNVTYHPGIVGEYHK